MGLLLKDKVRDRVKIRARFFVGLKTLKNGLV
jgi:hypothetical protein